MKIYTTYQRWIIFIISSSMFLTSQLYRASNAVIAPHLIQDLSLTTEDLGLITAVFFYAFAFTQIPVGLLLDRVGPRRTMAGLSLIGVVGAVIFAWSDSKSAGLLGRSLMGIGMACNLMGTLKLITMWFTPASFATLTGITISIGTLGNMAASTPLVLLVQSVGWRMAFSLIAAGNLLQIVLLYTLVRDRSQTDSHFFPTGLKLVRRNIFSDLKLLFSEKDYWIISCGAFFRYGVFAAVQTLWAGPYLMTGMGLSPLAAGNLIFLMNLALILGSPIWGGASDRLFKGRKIIILLSFMMLGGAIFLIGILPRGTHVAVLSVLFVCFGFATGTANILFAHIKERVPLELAGLAMTGINFFTMIGAAVFVHGLGSFMQRLYPAASLGINAFKSAFFLCAGSIVFSALLYLFTKDTDPRRTQ